MSLQRSVIVIGAGVIGCSVAHELAKRRYDVMVVDKGAGPGLGSTSSSVGLIRFNYSSLDSIRLAWESAHRWHRWADHLGIVDEAGMVRFHQTGMLVLDTPTAPIADTLAMMHAVGIAAQAVTTHDIAARWPALDRGRYFPPHRIDDDAFWEDAHGELGGVYQSEAGFIDDPALAAHNLMAAAQAHGATFRFRTEVSAITQVANRVTGVKLADGTLAGADIVVNVAGPHSSHINRLAGLDTSKMVGIRPMRQEVHMVAAPPGAGLDNGGTTVFDPDLGFYVRPQPGGTMLLGSLEPECDDIEWLDDADALTDTPTPERWEAQTTRMARRFPDARIPSRPTGLAALYDVSDDWVPIYDRSDLDGFYLAIGTSGNQFKNAPLAGEVMATIIDACEAGHDHDSTPVSLVGTDTGQTIDLGHFSRRRTVHRTSNSVLG
jgi:sarcosine oxidase, subunit beta